MKTDPSLPAILILAAGGSRRLGRPKQLLSYEKRTLLERALGTACEISRENTVLVLGSKSGELLPMIHHFGARTIINSAWQDGISSSIAAGIEKIEDRMKPESVIIMVCDQPFLDADHLRLLIDTAASTGKGIVASSYAKTSGTPVLMNRKYFAELLTLQGDTGARKLIDKYADDLSVVPFKYGEIDIDTLTDYEKLKAHAN